MNKLFLFLTIVFGIFLGWIIYLADTGSKSVFFELVRSLPYGDKIGHFMLFGILTLFVNLAMKMKLIQIQKLKLPLGSLLVLIFVSIEELSQGFISTRTLDITDFIADLVGILLFTYISFIIYRAINKERCL